MPLVANEKAYRVHGLPPGLTRQKSEEFLYSILKDLDDKSPALKVTVRSIGLDPRAFGREEAHQIATVSFDPIPSCLMVGDPWGSWTFERGAAEIEIDSHFLGFTPLNDIKDGEDHKIDVIAISGLSSHPFGSWKSRKGHHMWLRDSLPKGLPGARILLYGYNSDLLNSNSFQSINDIGVRLSKSITSIREDHVGVINFKPRPLIFIAHSLGGLVLKEAVIQLMRDDPDTHKSIYSIVFFGVPNGGILNSQWLSMVKNQPNESLIDYLKPGSSYLRVLHDSFSAAFRFSDARILSIYETRRSRVAMEDPPNSGKWALTGPYEVLVTPESARASVPRGPQHEELARDSDHSELVKFRSQWDDDYKTILSHLRRFSENAVQTIQGRFGVGARHPQYGGNSFSPPMSPAMSESSYSPPSYDNLGFAGAYKSQLNYGNYATLSADVPRGSGASRSATPCPYNINSRTGQEEGSRPEIQIQETTVDRLSDEIVRSRTPALREYETRETTVDLPSEDIVRSRTPALGALSSCLMQIQLFARSDRVKGIDLHPTEPWVLTTLYSGHACVWSYETQSVIKKFEVADVPVRAGCFIARKNWFVVGSDDFYLRVFNYNTSKKVTAFEAHLDYIRAIVVHPTQPYILTASDDNSIKLWDWEKSWKCTQTFVGHSHYVMSLAICPKNTDTFASASLDRTVKIWGLRGGGCASFTLEAHETKGVNHVAYHPSADKPYILTSSDDRTIKIWDYSTQSLIASLEGHTSNVSFACFHHEIPVIISGSEDRTIKVWHANTYQLEQTLSYGLERAWCVSYQRSKNAAAIGFDGGCAIIKIEEDSP